MDKNWKFLLLKYTKFDYDSVLNFPRKMKMRDGVRGPRSIWDSSGRNVDGTERN